MFRYHKLKLNKRKIKQLHSLEHQQLPHHQAYSPKNEDPSATSDFPITFDRPLKRIRYESSASDVSEYSYCSTETEDDARPKRRITEPSQDARNHKKGTSAYVSEEDSLKTSASIDENSLSEPSCDDSTRLTRRASYEKTKKSARMSFHDYFEQIKRFKEVHGHLRVTPKYDKKLANWVADMRNIRRQKNKWYGRKVTEEQLKSLDNLGFIWNPTKEVGGEKSFEYRIEQLKKFKAEHGHLRVTVKHDKNLSYFCSNIRAARRHAGRKRILKVTEERIKALDDLGFAWEPKPTQGDLAFWNHIKEMKAFKEKHGHVHITAKLDKKLAIFCTNMRNARRKTHTTRRLTEDRIKALDDLGFIWDPGQDRTLTSFEERVEQLKAFKEEHGHLNVPPKFDKKLFNFCVGIRKARLDPGRGRMVVTDEKIQALNAIDFDWDNAQGQYFDECFDALKSFKETHGHLRVTASFDENLATFCESIRNARRLLDRSGRLGLTGRIKELDELGFEWNS